jgi:EAL domain-containing protein (putative c-di-GMP-specific phosphodiesterase class I)
VNTTAGEAFGDRLLGAVAERLADCVRPGDLVARLGDDEFALLVGDVLGPDDAMAVASRVTAAVRDPFALGPYGLSLTASVGIALCQVGLDAGDVLRQAQLAVRAAKQRGGDRYELFDTRLARTFRRRIDLAAELTRAIDGQEFVVYYQPVVDLRSDAVVGFEALVRWRHPTRGVLLPDEFIPLAEENGAIDALGRWVLEEACRQAASWSVASGDRADIHVNLSARQLNNPSLAKQVDAALSASSIDPEHLVLEITETVLMDDIEASIAAIHHVREAGARFAIDDFGAGYSSFAYLTRLPVQLLKLDHSLIDRMAIERDAAVVETVVSLAHRIGLTALAEGVERPDQLEFVRRADCDLFQGFLFEEALPADRARLLLG